MGLILTTTPTGDARFLTLDEVRAFFTEVTAKLSADLELKDVDYSVQVTFGGKPKIKKLEAKLP